MCSGIKGAASTFGGERISVILCLYSETSCINFFFATHSLKTQSSLNLTLVWIEVKRRLCLRSSPRGALHPVLDRESVYALHQVLQRHASVSEHSTQNSTTVGGSPLSSSTC